MMMMMMHDNKSFLFVVVVMAVLLSVITAAAPDDSIISKSSKSSKSSKYSTFRSKLCKKTKRPAVSPTTKSPSFNPTTPSPTKTPSALCFLTDLNVFGDSLSDTGNGVQYYPCTETYCGDRASNGPLIVELISDALGLGPVIPATKPDATNPSLPIPSGVEGANNWAFSSASANTRKIRKKTNVTNDFAFQIELYKSDLEEKQGTTTSPSIEATTLQVVFFGGNDVREAVASRAGATTFIGASLDALITSIEALANMGACSFLVFGPPNVGLAPIVAKFQSERVTKLITDLSSFFSQALENRLSQINISNNDSKCLGVQFVDLFTLSNEYTDTEEFDTEFPDPLAYCNSRFAVPCEACNVVLGKFAYPLRVNTTSGICNCPVPVISEDDTQLECSQFAFFDELHTTTALNEKLTARILEDLIGEVKVDDLGEN